jgi:GPI mannosyltransferase 3
MTSRTQILVLMVIAVLVRIAALIPFSMHHPDEIFQYTEQAHRLVFGYGTVPWEYRYGMRSWLVPLLSAPLMVLGHLIAPSTILYAKLPVLLSVASGLSITGSAWTIGRRMGPLHGLIAGFVAAIWFEQIFFSVHILTEVLATGCILPAAALLTAKDVSRRQWLVSGFLLGLAFIFRFQYAPAIVLLLLITGGRDFRRCWLPIFSGGLIALLLSTTVDLAMGQGPFSWIVVNVQQNLILNRSANYGVDPATAYLGMIWQYWGWAAAPLFLLLIPAVERNRLIFYVALLNILVHMSIGHKEYRFIFLSVTILVILSAIGTAELAVRFTARFKANRLIVTSALLLFWFGSSVSLAIARPMVSRWRAFGSGMELARNYGASPGSCGIALHRLTFWQTGGYSYLHRDIPTYLTGWSDDDHMSQRDFRNAAVAFNAVIAPPGTIADRFGFRASQCAGSESSESEPDARVCLYIRPGGCDPHAAARWTIQSVLLRHDQ